MKIFNLPILLLLCLLLSVPAGLYSAQDTDLFPVVDAEGRLLITLEDLNQDIILQSTDGRSGNISSTVSLNFPPDWEIQEDIELKVVYVASEMLLSGASSLTVEVNNDPLKSVGIIVDSQPHEFTVLIPPDELRTSLPVTFRAHLTIDDAPCEIFTAAHWIEIKPETSFLIPPGQNANLRLTSLIRTLIPRNLYNRETLPILVVLPSYDDSAALGVATQLALFLGSDGFARFPSLILRTQDEVTTQELAAGNVILLGRPDNNQHIGDALQGTEFYDSENATFITVDGEAVPASKGVLYILGSRWNANFNTLILSGGNDAALEQVERVLFDRSIFRTLEGNIQFIDEEATQPAPVQEETIAPWATEITTLEQLGFDSRFREDRGASVIRNNIYFPKGAIMQDGAQFTLHVSHSPLLEGSHVAVFIEDNYIGIIDSNGRGSNAATFDLPVDKLNPILLDRNAGRLRMEIRIANVVDQELCFPRDAESIWTRIDNSSFFNVQFDHVPLPNLRVFPFPFSDSLVGTPTTIILPQDATGEDIGLALLLATRLGDWSRGNLEINIVNAENLPEDIGASHLIILGEIGRLAYDDADLPEFLDSLNQSSGKDALGLVLERISIYNDANGMLLITGNTVTDYAATVRALVYSSRDTELLAGATTLQETDTYRVVEQQALKP